MTKGITFPDGSFNILHVFSYAFIISHCCLILNVRKIQFLVYLGKSFNILLMVVLLFFVGVFFNIVVMFFFRRFGHWIKKFAPGTCILV